MMFYVYEVWDLTTDQPFYVGKAQSVEERHKQHLKAMNRKKNATPFLKKLRKMVQNVEPYEFRTVFETESEKDAFHEEMRLISEYGRRDLKNGPLLNITAGGEGMAGWIPDAETRALWSVQRSGKTPWNIGKTYEHGVESPKKGKPWSDAQRQWYENRSPEEIEMSRQRSSQSHKGQNVSEEFRRKHSIRMTGAGNPNYGKVGYFAGKVGPWAGKSHPNKGRKKGPDGKLYDPQQLKDKFGIDV